MNCQIFRDSLDIPFSLNTYFEHTRVTLTPMALIQRLVNYDFEQFSTVTFYIRLLETCAWDCTKLFEHSCRCVDKLSIQEIGSISFLILAIINVESE